MFEIVLSGKNAFTLSATHFGQISRPLRVLKQLKALVGFDEMCPLVYKHITIVNNRPKSLST